MSITAWLAKFLMEISTLVLLRLSCLSNGISGTQDAVGARFYTMYWKRKKLRYGEMRTHRCSTFDNGLVILLLTH